jgi:hypothetical protein
LQVHHILEKRTAEALGIAKDKWDNEIPAIVLKDKPDHLDITNGLMNRIPRRRPGEPPVVMSKDEIKAAYKAVYDEVGRPELFKLIEHYFN